MTLILNKVWILFVVAVILAPGFVEAFDLVGHEMLPKAMDCISVFGELLTKESYEFKKVFMITVVCNPLFGWFKNGNQFFASSDKIVFGIDSLLISGVPKPKSNSGSTNNESSRGNNDSSHDWCFHYAMYLLLLVVVFISINFLLWGTNNNFKHNAVHQPTPPLRHATGATLFGVGWMLLLAMYFLYHHFS